MDYPDIDHPDEDDLIDSLTEAVDHTGTACDGCNAALSEEDTVYVYGDWHGNWRITRTSCAECGDHLDDRPLVEAIVKFEVAEALDEYGEFRNLKPLGVTELNTSEGAVVR